MWDFNSSYSLSTRRLCMKHINIAMEKMDNATVVKDEENLSIIERIVQKTGNPKIAAVLALDLFLVGVDTVSNPSILWQIRLIRLIGDIEYEWVTACESKHDVRRIAADVWRLDIMFRNWFTYSSYPLQTSVAATSTIYQLSQNPDKQEILYNELKRIMPDPRSPVDTKTLEQMPFLRACIKETLR